MQVGFDALYFFRIDYQDLAKRKDLKSLEVIWRASKSRGLSADVSLFYSCTWLFHYSVSPSCLIMFLSLDFHWYIPKELWTSPRWLLLWSKRWFSCNSGNLFEWYLSVSVFLEYLIIVFLSNEGWPSFVWLQCSRACWWFCCCSSITGSVISLVVPYFLYFFSNLFFEVP